MLVEVVRQLSNGGGDGVPSLRGGIAITVTTGA